MRIWAENPKARINIIGPTASSVRSVVINGPSGLMQCYPPGARPIFEPSLHRITFPSGAQAETFSADEPERLRGPQCTNYWADEPCAWRFLEDAWNNLMFGFRLGSKPQGICTTTPKPSAWLSAIRAAPETICTRHSTYENRANLSPAFFSSVVRPYEGTRLGRQELLAEILEDTPGALWTLAMIEASRIRFSDIRWDRIIRTVVAVDPAVSTTDESDNTGIVVVALTDTNHVLVLDDQTCKLSPAMWGAVVVTAYRRHHADRVVAEVNNGGQLVERNIRIIEPNIPFRAVRASSGKYARAEPVAALYEQGRVHHVGSFPDLESEMATYVPGETKKSPDRMDALVWGITELVVDPEEASQTAFFPPFQISPI